MHANLAIQFAKTKTHSFIQLHFEAPKRRFTIKIQSTHSTCTKGLTCFVPIANGINILSKRGG